MISLPSDNGKKISVKDVDGLKNAIEKAKDDWKDTGGHIIIEENLSLSQESDPLEFGGLEFSKPFVIRANNVGERTISGRTKQVVFNNGRNVWLYGINFRHHASEDQTVVFRNCKNCVIAGCDFQTTSSNKRKDEDENNMEFPWFSYLAISGGDCNCVAYNNFHDKAPSRGHFLWVSGGGGPKRTIVEYNYFKKHPGINNSKGKKDKGEAIKMGDSAFGTKAFGSIVRYNLFEECEGDAEVITNKSSSNIYHHNTFRGNIGSLVLRHGNYSIVRDNVFLGRYNGIRVYGKQLVKSNSFRSTGKLDRSLLGPLIIGYGKEKEEKNEASYVKVKGSRFEKNVFLVEASDNDEENTVIAWGRKGSGSGWDEMPEDNKFVGNVIIAKSGTMLKFADEDAKKDGNEFRENMLYNDGSAKYGGILNPNDTSDQCRPPGEKPQITQPTILKDTDVGPKSTRSDQPHCSREELNEVIDFSEAPQKEELESLSKCS